MNLITHISKLAFVSFGLLSILTSVTASAQTSFATIPSASAKFDIDITVCKKTFNWDQFLTDINSGITNSNPYSPQTCGPENQLRLTDVVSNNYTKYNQAQIGTAQAKSYFGDDSIMGIFQNGNLPAQKIGVGSPAPVNRNSANALSNIFTTEQLNQIYSTGGSRTAMPRKFSTGWVDADNNGQNDIDVYANIKKFISLASNNRVNWSTCSTNGQFDTTKCSKQNATINECVTSNKFDRTMCEGTYQAGACEVVGGNLRVRAKRQGFDYDIPTDRNASTPSSSCAPTINGVRQAAVTEQNLQVYQFIYEIQYPTQAQCSRLPPSGVDFNSCREFYQTSLGKDLAGNTDLNAGNKISSVFTFYGSFDDKYSRWVGWRNPDSDIDSRSQSSNSFVNSYRGFSVYEN